MMGGVWLGLTLTGLTNGPWLNPVFNRELIETGPGLNIAREDSVTGLWFFKAEGANMDDVCKERAAGRFKLNFELSWMGLDRYFSSREGVLVFKLGPALIVSVAWRCKSTVVPLAVDDNCINLGAHFQADR